ncbi:hypothetical protein DPMN_187669 [Dreissena polymorpha]|uniref:TIR domain-containing protein n=1 Tax=Dreissena polymorpha TaxID=45954 RepID=A0A9D4I9A2_DREPO|nr:hypothetical protein DPMN_187669 [Dreissena polymorpha]
MALATLACIGTEADCRLETACINWLLIALKGTLKSDDRYCCGFTASECGEIIKNLTLNDKITHILVKKGAMPLLVELGTTKNENEQMVSVQAIWALCFNKVTQQKVVKDGTIGVVEFLIDKKMSEHSVIKEACSGALWTLRTAMKTSKNTKYIECAMQMKAAMRNMPTQHGPATKNKDTTNSTGHIMISYNSSDRTLITEIRDRLINTGSEVWMDVDKMRGSTTGSMAEAVENSSIVLICMSRKYKESPYCRSEAEYAYELGKTIIPLKTEPNYKPDGWLGLICAAKMICDFSGKYPTFEEPMSKLLNEINDCRRYK